MPRSITLTILVALLIASTLNAESFLESRPDIFRPLPKSRIACEFLTQKQSDNEYRVWRITPDGFRAKNLGRSRRVRTRLDREIAKMVANNAPRQVINRLKRDRRALRKCSIVARQCRGAGCSQTSDPINCTYVVQAKESINKYSAVAKSGEVICISAGIYNETLRPEISGNSDDLIIFAARPGAECKGQIAGRKTDCLVIIDGQNRRATGIDLSERNFVRVQGFEIRHHTSSGVTNFSSWYATELQSKGNQIVNNLIHHNGENGIDTENSNFALVDNNEIFANDATAVRIGGELGSSNFIGRNNNIHYNGKDGFQGGGDNVLIEGNVMYNQFHTDGHQDGIDSDNIKDWTIRYNNISDFTQLVYFHSDDGGYHENLEIYGNVLYTDKYWTINGGDAPGIFIGSARGRNISIHSNSCGWLGLPCVRVYGAVQNLKIYNNLMVDSGINIEIDDPSQIRSDYNLFFNTDSSNRAKSDSGQESHSKFGLDPMLVNYNRHKSYDFRLQPTSPAINQGETLSKLLSLPSPFIDLTGKSRPNGAKFDIGAYEY